MATEVDFESEGRNNETIANRDGGTTNRLFVIGLAGASIIALGSVWYTSNRTPVKPKLPDETFSLSRGNVNLTFNQPQAQKTDNRLVLPPVLPPVMAAAAPLVMANPAPAPLIAADDSEARRKAEDDARRKLEEDARR